MIFDQEHKIWKKYICLGMTAMLLTGCGNNEDNEVVEAQNQDPVVGIGLADAEGNKVDGETEDAEPAEPEMTDFEEVDYPFPYSMEDRRLLLCREVIDGEAEGLRFRMYDGEGNLLQYFPCDIEAEEFVFRFDNLCDNYRLNHDLAVFSADAAESGADGLLFSWDEEEDRFVEEPIIIPWYEEIETGISYSITPFLAIEENDNSVTKTIYYVNDKTRKPIKMRTWTLSGDGSEDEIGKLYIWDCLYKTVLYDGEVQWADAGKLVNDKYYQEVFWKDLPNLWNYTADTSIYTTKYIIGKDNWELEDLEYESREALLADCGFLDAEPFYQYYDRFGNLEMELYFNEETGKGCGFCYWYRFNYELEEIAHCSGFIFGGLYEQEWEDDTYSLLTFSGEDAEEYADIPDTLYDYNADDKLTTFEVSGYMEIEQNGELVYRDQPILSMEWIYRDDGTLYRKYYHHEQRCFGTTDQSQYIYYDELGRQVYRYAYITHGSCDYYYIYDGEKTVPKYCLFIDWNGASPVTEMIRYR